MEDVVQFAFLIISLLYPGHLFTSHVHTHPTFSTLTAQPQ